MKEINVPNKIRTLGNIFKNYIILLFIIGFIATYILFLYGEEIPNLILIMQFWTIFTIYIVLSIQFKKQKEKSQKEKGIAISQIEYLVYYIFDNTGKQSITDLQLETKKIINNLRRFYKEILIKIHCAFEEPETMNIYSDKNVYIINPVEIVKWEQGESKIITTNKEEIDKLIKNLRESI